MMRIKNRVCSMCGGNILSGWFCLPCWTRGSRLLRDGLHCRHCDKTMTHAVQIGSHFSDESHAVAMIRAMHLEDDNDHS